MIPVLYALFPGLGPANIISISLGTIVLNTALNNWRFHKKGIFPSKKSALIIFATSAVGALIGAQLVYGLPAQTLKKIFGWLLIILAARVALAKKIQESSEGHNPKPAPLAITCLIGSFISSITGLGGGAIFVPFFLSFVKIPLNLVSPYSNAAMMAASLIGLLPHFFIQGSFDLANPLAQKSFIGNVNLLFILCLFAGAFISSKAGVKLHGLSSARVKRFLLSTLLFGLALKILIA